MERIQQDFGIFKAIAELVTVEKHKALPKLRQCQTIDQKKQTNINHVKNLIKKIKDTTQSILKIRVDWDNQKNNDKEEIKNTQEPLASNSDTNELKSIRDQLNMIQYQIEGQVIPSIDHPNQNIIIPGINKLHMSLSGIEQKIALIDQKFFKDQNINQTSEIKNLIDQATEISNNKLNEIISAVGASTGRINDVDKNIQQNDTQLLQINQSQSLQLSDICNLIKALRSYNRQPCRCQIQTDYIYQNTLQLQIMKISSHQPSLPYLGVHSHNQTTLPLTNIKNPLKLNNSFNAESMRDNQNLSLIADQGLQPGMLLSNQIIIPDIPVIPNILNEIQEVASYPDQGQPHWMIMQLMNGNYVVGGDYEQLILLDQQLSFIKHIDIYDILGIGIAVGNYLYCCIKVNTISVIDQNTFNIIKDIRVQSNVLKLLIMNDDYLLVGQFGGYIDIIQISTHTNVFQGRLTNQKHIFDIVCIDNNEYAFATSDGLVIGTFTFNNNNIIFNQQSHIYLQGNSIDCVQVISDHQLVVGESDNKQLQLIDTNTKQVTTLNECGKYDGQYNVIQRINGYNIDSFPYLIVKDQSKAAIINVKTFKLHTFINCQYGNNQMNNSLIQVQPGNQLQFLTVYHNYENKERSVKKFNIAIKQ